MPNSQNRKFHAGVAVLEFDSLKQVGPPLFVLCMGFGRPLKYQVLIQSWLNNLFVRQAGGQPLLLRQSLALAAMRGDGQEREAHKVARGPQLPMCQTGRSATTKANWAN